VYVELVLIWLVPQPLWQLNVSVVVPTPLFEAFVGAGAGEAVV
jgi:hypothetical protein